MLVQVLGPVTVTGDNGIQVQLRPRERALLLPHAGQPCQTEMLADSLCAEKRPRHPEEAVRLHMGRIRQALESQGLPPIVVKMYRAYRIDLPAGSLDLHRFRNFLVAARIAGSVGDRESAGKLAEKALACWPNGHGRLPDLPDTPGLIAIACQLAVRRHKAQTWLASLQVDLGRHEELILVLRRGGDADARCLAQR